MPVDAIKHARTIGMGIGVMGIDGIGAAAIWIVGAAAMWIAGTAAAGGEVGPPSM
jgi:hypothetical protein